MKLEELLAESEFLFEDKLSTIFLPGKAASLGHVMIVRKEHTPIFEQVPDFEVAHFFDLANKISTVLFENLKIQGTNILIQNGVAAHQTNPFFTINIIPRNENDGINLLWEPRQLSEEEMSTVELKIKEEMKTVGVFDKKPEKSQTLDKPVETIDEDDENYLLKHIQRIG